MCEHVFSGICFQGSSILRITKKEKEIIDNILMFFMGFRARGLVLVSQDDPEYFIVMFKYEEELSKEYTTQWQKFMTKLEDYLNTLRLNKISKVLDVSEIKNKGLYNKDDSDLSDEDNKLLFLEFLRELFENERDKIVDQYTNIDEEVVSEVKASVRMKVPKIALPHITKFLKTQKNV